MISLRRKTIGLLIAFLPAIVPAAILCTAGCGSGHDVNEHMNERSFVVFAGLVSEPPPDRAQILHENLDINGTTYPVTRFQFTAEDIDRSVGMTQQVTTGNDSRLIGLKFYLRNLTKPCTLSAVLRSSSKPYGTYLHKDPIQLDGSDWKQVVLTFSNFADNRSGLYLDLNTFRAGDKESMKLFLLPNENDGVDRVIQWGPLEPVYQDHRYRFH